MAIARDNSATFVNPASGSSNSFTTSGSDRYGYVFALDQNSSNSAMTWNGVAMTLILSLGTSNVSGGETMYVWGLANPTLGASNIIPTYTGSNTFIIDIVSYTGAQQTTALEATATNTGASSSVSQAVTTLTNNAWLVGYARGQSTITAGANTIIVTNNSSRDIIDSNAAQTPAGSHSLAFNLGGATQFGIIVTSLKPFVAATTNSNFLAFM